MAEKCIQSIDESSLSFIASYELEENEHNQREYNDDNTPIISLNNSTSDLNIISTKSLENIESLETNIITIKYGNKNSFNSNIKITPEDIVFKSSIIVENDDRVLENGLNELKREIIDDYVVAHNLNDDYCAHDDDVDDVDSDKRITKQCEQDCSEVDIFLETPAIDEHNIVISNQITVAKPKRLSNELYSIDDDDYNENNFKTKCIIKNENNSSPIVVVDKINLLEQKREGVLVLCRSAIDTSTSSSSAAALMNNKIDYISQTTTSSPLLCNYNNNDEVDEHSLIVNPKIVINTNNNEDDDLNYDENDVQSMDAIERRDYEHEQKLTGGVIVRNCSLTNNENRLKLGLVNNIKNDDDSVKSDEGNKKTSQKNTLTSTPTSSRSSTIRTTKSAVKLNLSATLDRVAANGIKNESDNISLVNSSNNSKIPIDVNKKINCKLNNVGESISSSSSSSLCSTSSATTSTIRNRQQLNKSVVDGCFLNMNSNDSLSSDEDGVCKDNNRIIGEIINKNIQIEENERKNNSNQLIKPSCSSSSLATSSKDNSKIICPTSSATTSSSSSPNCPYVDFICRENFDDHDEVEIINDDEVHGASSKQFDNYCNSYEFPSSSSASGRLRTLKRNPVDRVIEEECDRRIETAQMIISISDREQFEDDTWADCDEGFDIEEVCTCKNYPEEDDRYAWYSEDELPSRDVDLSGFTHIDATLPDDILHDPNDTTPRIHRKRKLTGNLSSDTTPGGRKRLALQYSLSPRKALMPSTPTLSGTSPLFLSPLSERRTPRSIIPTKDNPPPELGDWLKQFQKWSHAERILAVDRLIERCEPTQVRYMMKVIEPQFQRDFISLLPKEVALQVLTYLEPNDLLRAAQTCRSWRFLCDDNLLWKEKCKQVNIVMETLSDRPKRGRAGNMPPISSEWKAAYMRQHIIEMNWRSRPIREPKILKGHDDHVITCLQFCGNRIVSGSDDNTLKVWSAVSGKCLRTLVGHTGGVWSSQMAGNIIISGSTDRTLKVWNAETGHCIHTLYGHTSTVRCMHLHEHKVVSGSRDATLRVWDINTGICLHVLVGHLAAVRCVQYDGRLVVSGAYDYMVKVWNPEKQECLHTLQGHTNRVYSLQFDGIHVVSGSLDTSIRVWDAETGSCKHTLMGHQSLTSGMELRQNILVSGNADSTVKVWDIITGQCLQTLSGSNKHQSAVTCLQFNSRFVITSSDDGTVKLWDVKTGEFIRNLVALDSGGSGGVVWRIRANDTKLVCAVGSRNGTEETKLMVLDFDVEGACLKCS